MNHFMQLPTRRATWVPAVEIALVERGDRNTEVVMTATANGYVHGIEDHTAAEIAVQVNDHLDQTPTRPSSKPTRACGCVATWSPACKSGSSDATESRPWSS
jgi:hypothetical protein